MRVVKIECACPVLGRKLFNSTAGSFYSVSCKEALRLHSMPSMLLHLGALQEVARHINPAYTYVRKFKPHTHVSTP